MHVLVCVCVHMCVRMCVQDAAEVSDHHDRVRLIKEDRYRQEQQQQQQQQMLVVSDEASHLENRAARMGEIEVRHYKYCGVRASDGGLSKQRITS